MRLFTGISLPPEIKERLEGALRKLRPTAKIKWSPVKNMHITTKFIGEWDAGRLDELTAALAAVASPGPFRIAIRGLGWFPNERAPRVFWAGIEAGEGLAELARRIDDKAAELGVEKERRRFSPHLTLARIKGPADLRELRRAIEEISPIEFGGFEASSYHLYLSEPRAGGSVYTSLREYEL